MRRIAVINQKGGVGKTTITAHVGHALSLLGCRVTVDDMDPQGHLAASYGLFRAPARGLDEVLLNGAEIENAMISARDLLFQVPAGTELNKVEEMTQGGASRARLLEKALAGSLGDQDCMLFDCPPSSGILIANTIICADEALIPVSGDYLSINSLANMLRILKKFERLLVNSLCLWVGLSRFVSRRRLSKEVLEKILYHFTDKVMATPIREAAVMAECLGAGRTIFEYRESCKSAKDFKSLAIDLIERRAM